MSIKIIKSGILAVGLFSGLSAAVAKENFGEAPKATAYEAEIKHWRMPEIDRKFTDIPLLEKAYLDFSPLNLNDGIPTGKLGLDGGKQGVIEMLAGEIADGKHGKIDSLLMVQNGKLLFESYYRRGRIDLSHPQSSATKSYTGLALGRAIQLGYLSMSDLDKPLVSFLKDLKPSKFVKGAEKITLYQALTMTTGIRLSEENRQKMKENQSKLIGQESVQAQFELSDPITEESRKFSYSPGPGFVMQVLDAVVPGTAKEFIKKEFLGKLGITNYDWKIAPNGLPEAGWKVSMTSRDMAKIGIMAMNKGRWNGEQFIPEAFIAKATSRINYSGDADIFGGGKDVSNQGYGFFWWSGDLQYGNKSYFSASAQGGGGVYIILIEELDLTVVVTAHHRNNQTLQLTAERILPAFIR